MDITNDCIMFLTLKIAEDVCIGNAQVHGYNTSYPTRANGIIVLVNSQSGFCRRFLFPQFYKASGKRTWRTIFHIT